MSVSKGYNYSVRIKGNFPKEENKMTKLEEETTYYVVNTADDGSDAFAVKFDNLEDAEKYRDTQENNSRERELLTEKEFLTNWSKPAESYDSEESASEDGYVWDDQLGRWIEVDIRDN